LKKKELNIQTNDAEKASFFLEIIRRGNDTKGR
jgi:hypothetical protein